MTITFSADDPGIRSGGTPLRSRLLLALAGVLAFAFPSFATVARSIPFDQKVDQADAIFLGKCVATSSSFDPSGRWIVTQARFTVEKSLKGNAGSTVDLVVPGGSVSGIHQETIGVPAFREGDERIVFLKGTPAGASVLYFDQGTYAVRRDSAGRRSVAPAASDLILLDPQTGKVSPDEPPRSLETFEGEIRAAAERIRDQRLSRSAVSRPEPPRKSWQDDLRDFLMKNRLLLLLIAAGVLLSLYPLLRRR